jgi:putative hydrolase of the HAD superfamily
MTQQPRALLFDLGGVIMALDWDRVFATWAAASGANAEDLRARYSFDAAYQRHERGEIGELEYYQALRESLGIDIDDQAWADGWGALFVGEIEPTVELLERVKDRIPVYAFSNTNPTHERIWSKKFERALGHFRKVFVSSSLGARKPERVAFEMVAEQIGVPMHETLFFDDTLENVEGARAAGLQAIHVKRPQDVRDALRPWLD